MPRSPQSVLDKLFSACHSKACKLLVQRDVRLTVNLADNPAEAGEPPHRWLTMYASHASHAYIVKILCAQAVPPRRANERAAALPVRRVAHARWSRKTELQTLAAARRRLLAGVGPRVENVVLVAP